MAAGLWFLRVRKACNPGTQTRMAGRIVRLFCKKGGRTRVS